MSAYIVVQVEITNPVRYEDYRKMVPPTLTRFGGRFIVRGGQVETVEGTWAPKRFVVLEFPDADRARAWWASEEYAEAKALRQATSRTEMILVDGV